MLGVTARNLANLNTDGFKASRQTDSEVSDSEGVRAKITTPQTPGPIVAMPERRELSNTDLAQEQVNLLTARRAYQANIKSLQAADEMTKSTLNIIA